MLLPAGDGLGRAEDLYNPLEDCPALFREFADLDPDDRDGIAAFAARYGMLGLRTATTAPRRADGGRRPGERHADWAAHIDYMRAAIWLWERAEAGDRRELSGCLRRATSIHPSIIVWMLDTDGIRIDRYPNRPRRPFEAGFGIVPAVKGGVERAGGGDVVVAARVLLGYTITQFFQRHPVAPMVMYAPDSGRYELRFRPPNLATAMWLQLAQAVVGNKRHRACRSCGRWFEMSVGDDARTARREFCSGACKVRDHRARKAKALAMAEAGEGVKAIAKATGTAEAVVRGWVKGLKKKGG